MLLKWLLKCSACDAEGTLIGAGMIEKNCNKCKLRKKAVTIITVIKNWIFDNPFKTTPVGVAIVFFILAVVWFLKQANIRSFGLLVTAFGTILIALKYKLDQADYHKSLFDKGYEVFIVVDEILRDCFHEVNEDGQKTDKNYCVRKLDSIYRRGYFLFGKKTNQFLNDFRKAVVDLKTLQGKENEQTRNEAGKFLSNLLDGQKLSQCFPELKIDFYCCL